MKNVYVLITLFCAFLSCSDDDRVIDEVQNAALEGSWSHLSPDENDALVRDLIYTFTLTGNYEESLVVRDKSSNEVLGYKRKTTGRYELSENRLALIPAKAFRYDEGEGLYEAESGMVASDLGRQYSFSYSFDQDRSELTFDYDPCGPLEDCIDKRVFQKISTFSN